MSPHRPYPVVKGRRRAFSLVLSLTIMAMLLLLAIGTAAMLVLELTVSRATVAQAKARLNAVAGARIALGTLQAAAGIDKVVTANGAILARDGGRSTQIRRPRLTGVWRSAVVADAYDNNHDQAFKGWLMSGVDASGFPLAVRGTDRARTGIDWMLSGAAEKTADDWLLLDGGTQPYDGLARLRDEFDAAPGAREPLRLYARAERFSPVTTDATGIGPLGSYAWVVTDENQKARVDLREFSSTDLAVGGLTENQRAAFFASAASRFHPGHRNDGPVLNQWSPLTPVAGGLVGGWPSLPLDPNGNETVTPNATGWFPLELDGVTPARALRHDFTVGSTSLLTDVVSGGLKRDLNTMALLTESDFSSEMSQRFDDPQGLVGMDVDRSAWYLSRAPQAVSGLFPLTGNTRAVWPTFANLRQWARFSTDATPAGLQFEGGMPFVNRISWADMKLVLANPDAASSLAMNAPWRQPVLSKIRFETSLESVPVGTDKHRIFFRLNVIAQIWNPYNVRMKMPSGSYIINMMSVPFIPRWYANSVSSGVGGNGGITNTFHLAMPLEGLDMEPGEIRTFSSPFNSGQLNRTLVMTPGYVPGGGYMSEVFNIDPKSTDEIFFAAGRLSKPSEVPGASQLDDTLNGQNGSFRFYGSMVNEPTSPSNVDLVARVGAIDNQWLRVPDNHAPGTLVGVGPASGLVRGARGPIAIFEYRLKTEKLPNGAGRFTPPPLLYQGGWSWGAGQGGRDQDRRSAPYELVGWIPDVNVGDNERYPQELTVIQNGTQMNGVGVTGATLETGVRNPVFYHIPLTPPLGLGEVRNARLGTQRILKNPENKDAFANSYAVNTPFGNSIANPHVPLDKVYQPTGNLGGQGSGNLAYFSGPDAGIRPVDQSWVFNTALGDSWFASSLGNWNQGATGRMFGLGKDYPTQLREFFVSGRSLPNRRFTGLFVADAESKWANGTAATRAAYRQIASGMLVDGGFNVNSTSIRAWRAFLGSTRDSKVVGLLNNAFGPVPTPTGNATALPGPVVNAAPVVAGGAAASTNNAARVNGGRDLSDDELDSLAVALVAEVKKRGPFLSLGEFLNRRIENSELGRKGAVQAAIDTAGLNAHRTVTGTATAGSGNLGNPEFAQVYDTTGVGTRGWLSQADLLAPLLPAMTPRGDTFTIRVAGESEEGARVYCELVVRRGYDYVDGRDAADTEFEGTTAAPLRTVNKAFGRRFVVVSQRWLSRDEI